MALAETARLIASLELKDKNFAAGVTKADASLNKLDKSTSKIGRSKGFGGLTKSVGGLGKAFGNAGKAASGFASTIGPLLGVGGVLGIGAVFTSAINKAEEFGNSTIKLNAVIGLGTDLTSRYVDTLGDYGITVEQQLKVAGLFEKNVGKLAGSTKTAAKFQKDYGFSLLDSKGKAVDFNEALLRSADFFTSNATATQKATALNALYGKGWQTLIPILSKGRKGLKDELNTADSLTKAQIAQFAKLKTARREFNDQVDKALIGLGLEILPTITEALSNLTNFLSTHKKDVTAFFKGIVSGAKEVASAVTTFVVPIGKAIFDAFNAIPPDIRKLLIGGAIANKALKVTFGFDPLKIVGGGIASAIKDAFGGFFSRGAPGNPMFTKEVGLAGAGGLDVSKGGTLKNLLKFGAALGLAAVALELLQGTLLPLIDKVNQQGKDLTTQAGKFGGTASQADISAALAFAKETKAAIDADPVRKAIANAIFHESDAIDATIAALEQASKDFGKRAEFTGGFKGFEGQGPGFRPTDAIGNRLLGQAAQTQIKKLDQLHQDFIAQRAILQSGTDAQKATAAAALAKDVQKGVGNVANTKDLAAQLRATALTVKDPELRKQINAAAARIEGKIQGREWIAAQKEAAAKIARSNESVGQKVRELKGIQQSLIAHGDTAAAKIVGALLSGVVPAINALKNGINVNLPGILPQPNGPRRNQNAPDVPVAPRRNPRQQPGRGGVPDLFVKVTASHRDASGAKAVRNRYGPTPAEAGAT